MQDNAIKKLLLSGSAWVFFGKLLLVAGGLLLNAFLARLLTPGELGTYLLIFSLVQFLAIVGQLGLSQAVLRLVANSMGSGEAWSAKAAVVSALGIALVASLCVILFLLLWGGEWVAVQVFKSAPMNNFMSWAALLVLIYVFQSLVAEIFRGFYDIKKATLFGGLSNTVLTALLFGVLWVVFGASNLKEVLVVSVISGGLSVLISMLMLGKKLALLPQGPRVSRVKELITLSWPLWVTAMMFFMLSQADLWIMGAFRADDEVALYGAAFRLVLLMTLPLFIVSSVVPPMIVEMHASNNIPRLEHIMRITTTVAAIPAILLLTIFAVWSKSILGIVFGDFYQDASMILVILSLGHFVNVLVGACGLTLMMTGHQVTVMVITLVSGILTIASAILLVHNYGALGVASAASGGMVLQNIASLIAVKLRLGFWTHVKWVTFADVKNFGAVMTHTEKPSKRT